MNFQPISKVLFVLLLLGFQISKAESITGNFEILDLTGEIRGEPQLASDAARNSWQRACNEWKTETKDLNKKNEMIAINCESPSCALVDSAKTQCTSTGTYKIKTAGTRVNNAPEPAQAQAPTYAPPQQEVITAPPPVIVETVPAPRMGFVWIPGFWGWQARHHIWIPGRWTHDRPGSYWVHDRWSHSGHGWRFETGHWAHR